MPCCDILYMSREFVLAGGELHQSLGEQFGTGIKTFRIIPCLV